MSFNQLEDTTVEVVSSVANKATMAGGAGSAIGFLTSSTGIAVTGLAFALVGLLVSWYFQRKRDQRDQAEFELRKQTILAEDQRNALLHQAQMTALTHRED